MSRPATRTTPRSEPFTVAGFHLPGRYLPLLVGRKAAAALCGTTAQALPMPSVTFLRLCLEYMRTHDDEAFGASAKPVPKGTFGILMAAAGQGSDFAGALKRFAAAAALLRPDLTIRYRRNRRGLNLSIRYDGARSARKELVVETFAMTVQCGLRWLTGQRLIPAQVTLAEPVGGFQQTLLKAVFGCPAIRKGSGVTLCYRAADAGMKLAAVKYNAWASHEFVEFMRLLEEAAAARNTAVPAPGCDFAGAVRRAVAGGSHDETQVARRLGMSTATLRRRLSESGTSFRVLLDDVQRGAAATLLMTDKPLDDVAAELGYSDVRSFRRVCRRWLGTTPGAYRRRAATQAAPRA